MMITKRIIIIIIISNNNNNNNNNSINVEIVTRMREFLENIFWDPNYQRERKKDHVTQYIPKYILHLPFNINNFKVHQVIYRKKIPNKE